MHLDATVNAVPKNQLTKFLALHTYIPPAYGRIESSYSSTSCNTDFDYYVCITHVFVVLLVVTVNVSLISATNKSKEMNERMSECMALYCADIIRYYS